MSVTGAPGHPYAYSCGDTVLNGARIGAGSLVAGARAEARRELTEEERGGIRLNATVYVEPAKSHRAAAEDR